MARSAWHAGVVNSRSVALTIYGLAGRVASPL